ncbi:MAG: ABC transporter ATP-binding protein [Deltaproteobacteria bacterium]|nr:ABC transporter ATP-binding protein [Deltaproteobacteria bacterium]
MPCLQVQNLTKTFGGLTAVNDVSFVVEEGSISGLIGPNGSGKTVTFDCITGLYRPDHGRISFRGQDITGRRPDEIALLGVGRSFQLTGIFPGLTVLQNLLFAAQEKGLLRNLGTALRGPGGEEETGERIRRALEFIGLWAARGEAVANLPYGQQKLLELGGLMLMNPEPSLYLLDEPFAGLTQGEISGYIALTKEMRARGKTFLIVEHNMRLDHGEKIAEGGPREIQGDSRVVRAYLGHASAARSS